MSEATISLPNAPQDDVVRLVTAAQDALTDGMVERLATLGANALDVVDRLNDEDTRAAIHMVIDRLTELHRTGALETLFDLVMLMHGAKNAMTDSIIERLFAFVEHMLNNVATEEMATLADTVRISMDDALTEVHQHPPKGGMFNLAATLMKPETQRTIRFFLLFAEKFQEKMVEEPQL